MALQRYKNPVAYFEGTLIFTHAQRSFSNMTGKECWACYRIPGSIYDFLKNQEKISMLLDNARGYQQVFSEGHLLEIPVQNKISDNFNYLRGLASGEMKPIGLKYIDEAEELLSQEEQAAANDSETYFLVKLKKPRTLKDLKDILLSFLKEPYRSVNELFGLDVYEIYKREFEAFKRLEQSLKSAVKRYINIRELTETDIERLIRDPFFRGLPAPRLRSKSSYYDPFGRGYKKDKPWKPSKAIIMENGEKIYRPLKRDILALCEGKIDNRLTHLEVTQQIKGEPKAAYQKFIVVSGLPDIEFPTGREWLYRLKDLGFPIWRSVRYVKKEYYEVSSEINKKRKELDDQLTHFREVDSRIPQQYLDQDEEIEKAKYEVDKEKKPFLYTSVVLCVASDSLAECNDRVKAVQDYFDELDIETQVPTGDQWKLFNEMLIGGKRYLSDYIQRIPPETLAGSMIGANTVIGDPLGIYIAITSGGGLSKPVYFDPSRPSQINESPSASFTGTLGRGKSLLVKLIVLWAAMLGAKIFFVDPKGENANWTDELPELKPYVNIIELSTSKEYTGRLDIFRVMINSLGKNATRQQKKEISKKAAEYALSILGTIAGYSTADEKMEYLEDAVNITANSDNPCMMDVIKTLGMLAKKSRRDGNGPAAEIYERLEKTFSNKLNTTAYGHLLFGDGIQEAVDITRQINILMTQNLVLPDEGKLEENFTSQERVGMAVLIAVSSIGMQFALQSRNQLKIYVQDEASVFKRSAQGKAMFNRMVKMGRSENAPIYLIGQNISDLGESEDVRANIGTRFCFGTKTHEEAKSILRYIGLDEESKDYQDMLIKLPTGTCLMRDVEGKISIIAVDPLLDKFLRAFNTKPALKIDSDEATSSKAEKRRDEHMEEPSPAPEVKQQKITAEWDKKEKLTPPVLPGDDEESEEGENDKLNDWGK